MQQSAEEHAEESRDVPIIVTGESEQNELVKSTTGRTEVSQRKEEVHVIVSHTTEVQEVSEKTESKSVNTRHDTLTDWHSSQCGPEGAVVEMDTQINYDIFSHVCKLPEPIVMDLDDFEAMEKHECEQGSEKSTSGRGTPRISKISIGSAKVEHQTKKKSSDKRRKEEVSQCKSVDLRAPSPFTEDAFSLANIHHH
ncbi:hypothetical protein E3U43_016716 [Larimichthys crocea]|uniref:Uncharacterized protein n=1 Tax=Larimichthys crocea TaxID=215358 RepID=A0ACD3QIH5_LARCR|nr:hypothetical protein E3U43_016716 [Larimichthys crocea]